MKLQHVATLADQALTYCVVDTPDEPLEQVTVVLYAGDVKRGDPPAELQAIHQYPEMPAWQAAELVEAIARRFAADVVANGGKVHTDERPVTPGPAKAIVRYSDRRASQALALVIYRVVATVNHPARYLSVQPI